VPTRNEHDNVRPVYEALCQTLQGIDWEAIFVDDDSQDGTPEAIYRLANQDRRVRCIQRIGRRGLASAEPLRRLGPSPARYQNGSRLESGKESPSPAVAEAMRQKYRARS
jgi:hypothetical protein